MATSDAAETGDSFQAEVAGAALAGVLAGLAFGLMIQNVLGRMPAIGAMYTLGDPSLSVGWVAHIGHSAIFGAVFALVAQAGAVRRLAASRLGAVGAGLAFAGTLWAVNIVFVWPLWLNAVGVPNAPAFPFLGVRPLVGHLLWGGLLGALYPTTRRLL